MFVLLIVLANYYHSFASLLVNVFRGILNNPLFCAILLGTSGLQAIIVQYGSVAFHVAEGGLDGKYWGISLAFGAGSLPVQQCINLLYRAAQHYKRWRNTGRVNKNYDLQTRNAGHDRESQRSLDSHNSHPHHE
jgi:Ca2+ transporting ATPase